MAIRSTIKVCVYVQCSAATPSRIDFVFVLSTLVHAVWKAISITISLVVAAPTDPRVGFCGIVYAFVVAVQCTIAVSVGVSQCAPTDTWLLLRWVPRALVSTRDID